MVDTMTTAIWSWRTVALRSRLVMRGDPDATKLTFYEIYTQILAADLIDNPRISPTLRRPSERMPEYRMSQYFVSPALKRKQEQQCPP